MLKSEVLTQTPLYRCQEVQSPLPQVDLPVFDAGSSLPFYNCACCLPEDFLRGRQEDFRKAHMRRLSCLERVGSKFQHSLASPCSVELNKDYSMATNKGYLFRVCCIKGVSITGAWQRLKSRQRSGKASW